MMTTTIKCAVDYPTNGFHYGGDSGTFMKKSLISALLKFRIWYALCLEGVCYRPQMKKMNKYIP